MFAKLPHDIVILVLASLSAYELAALAQTCRFLHCLVRIKWLSSYLELIPASKVTEYGWSSYHRSHPRPSLSLSRARASWSPRFRVKYDALNDAAWSTNTFVARPLSDPWPTKNSPLLAISTNRLVVASRNHIHSYKFESCGENSTPAVSFEGSFSLLGGHEPSGDITSITLATTSGHDDTFFIGFQDGLIECIILGPSSGDTSQKQLTITRLDTGTSPNTHDFSESLSSASHFLLSLSLNGSARLADHRDLTATKSNRTNPTPTLAWYSSIELKTRSWASHLCLSSSMPYAAFGTSNPYAPLPVYHLPDLSFPNSGAPSVLLTAGKSTSSSSFASELSPAVTAGMVPDSISSAGSAPLHIYPSSAVYGLSQAPPCSPWGSSPQILVGGWYDSKVRCYDLRLPTSLVSYPATFIPTFVNGPLTTRSIPSLSPVLSLYNPWSYEPIYSISCGGGSGSHIAAGSARHSVLSFWDVRNPSGGWSVHAPGNDPSPVYSVILESSRCFGATERRPFVYDFVSTVCACLGCACLGYRLVANLRLLY